MFGESKMQEEKGKNSSDTTTIEFGPETKKLLVGFFGQFGFTSGRRLQVANIPIPIGDGKDAFESIANALAGIHSELIAIRQAIKGEKKEIVSALGIKEK